MSWKRFRTIIPGLLLLAAGWTAAPCPALAVPATNGEGVMVVDWPLVDYGTTNTFTFTFTANIGDFGDTSQVLITVPAGWTLPTTTTGAAGFVSVSSGTCTLKSSPLAIAGAVITIDPLSCLAGQFFTVTYADVPSPSVAGSPYTFLTESDIGTGGLGPTPITAGSPVVNVIPLVLTVSDSGLTPADKTYDGGTGASLTIGSPTLVGVVGTDDVSLDTTGATATFANRNAGAGKAVSIDGLFLGGAAAVNYVLFPPSRSASILQRPVTVTAATDGKVYDGTTDSAGVPVLSAGTPLAPGDTPPAWTQGFDTRNAGVGKTLTPAGTVNDGNGGLNYAYTFVADTTGVITQRPVTVTAVTATKVYDGTTGSTGVPVVSAATPLGTGDSAAALTQSYDNRNVGTGKTLTPAGTVSDGNGGLNYTYTFVADTTGAITRRALRVTAVPDTKGYDGTTDSAGVPVPSAGTPLAPGDTAPAWTQSFDNRNAGTGKTLTPAGTVSDGNGGLNYNYIFVANPNGAISQRPITVTAVTDGKVYDGTTNSAGVPALSATTPLAAGDTAPAWTQGFDNRNAGTGKSLTPAGAVNDGNGGLNYAYAFVADTTGVVTPLPITVAAAADGKVYDGTTASAAVPVLSPTTPLAPGDTALAWTQSFDNRNVGAGKTLTPAGTVSDGNGGLNYAYTFLPVATGAITQRAVTVTAVTATKIYDGTTASAGLPVVSAGTPLGAGDSAPALTQSYDTRNVGTGKTLTPAGTVSDGNGGLNYTYSFVPAVTGAITQRPVTVTAVPETKVYDGTTSSAGAPVLSAGTPLGAGDGATAWTQTFDTRNAGTGKTLTPAGTVNDGNGGLNYACTFVTVATGAITQRPITVTAVTDAKAYDGTTSSTGVPVLAPTTPLAPGDGEPAWTQTFDTRSVGTGKTLTPAGTVNDGNGGLNYACTFVPNLTGVITGRPITVTAVPDSKVYDGTVGSIGVPVLSAGTLAPGDTAPAWTQTFDNRNVGAGKSLIPAGLVNDGEGGQSYLYNFVPDATGVIAQRAITVTAVPDSKIYDGTTGSAGVPVLSGLTPLASGDSEPVWAQSFDTPHVGTGKTLTPAGAVVDGNGGLNYAYTFTPDMTGAIGLRPVTVAANAQRKGLGTPDPPLSYQVTAGSLIVGDMLTLTRVAGEAPGAYAISIGSFPAAGDYDLTYIGASLTITPTLRFFSDGALDGWVLESTRTSSVGGSANSKATTFRLGDDPAGRQYRAILSFNTSLLPDTAVIKNALLEIRRSGAPTGTNPFGILGKLRADVRKGSFGPRPLAPSDFQATPTLAGAGIFGATPVGPVYRARLSALGRSKVNAAGITQFRLSFAMGDNGDRGADFMKFVSGNAAAGQPQLTITYALP